jgi:hypothetical protein
MFENYFISIGPSLTPPQLLHEFQISSITRLPIKYQKKNQYFAEHYEFWRLLLTTTF